MFDANFIADPYSTYRMLRAGGPVHWAEEFYGGSWLLPRYADVAAALKDPRLSARRSHVLVEQFPIENQTELAEFKRVFAMWMLFLDPPQHTRLRKLMNKAFTPSMLQYMRPRIQQTVDSLLDAVKDRGEMEFMREFAHPLPALAIAEVLGVDTADQADFITWSDDIAAFFGNPAPTLDMARIAQASLVAFIDYFRAILPERRRNSGDDLISLLIRVEEEGDVLTTEELLAQCTLLLGAGHETTRNLLGSGLLALLRHPDQLSRLRNDAALIPIALREFLRYESPVQFTGRTAIEDFTLHGQSVKKGQTVISIIGAANRDSDKFVNPDALDVTRNEGPNLAFGFGPHVCIGSALSYMEGEIAFETLLQRCPTIRLADDTPDWRPNPGFRGLNTLQIALPRNSP